jgi:beta-N-acetylglucosaminidase
MQFKKLCIGLLFFFCFVLKVYAVSYNVEIIGNAVNLREDATTSSTVLKILAKGSVYVISDKTLYTDKGGCSAGWYKINVDATTGYVCANYANVTEVQEKDVTTNSDCEKELKELGFPESYWSGLCALKTQHPTWKFQALITNLDFSTAVDAEASCGTSYIQTTNEEYIDKSCKSAYSSTSSWKPASQKAVAYYMDPRNFFDEKHIFQFEYLKYDTNLKDSYITGISSILKNAKFYIYHSPNGIELATVINEAGMDTDVSPIFLASRMLQELGSGDAEYNLYSGIYEGEDKAYYGYYNFFNIGVSDVCATTYGTAYCGLTYAKNNDWDSPYNAIKGASNNLAKNYIAAGQYTDYLQKFNVVPLNVNRLYLHQYMTNIGGPSSEAVSAYNTYKKLDSLESSFVFYIPVYVNMDAQINNSDNGETDDVDIIKGDEKEEVVVVPISTLITSSGYNYSTGYISKIEVGTSVSTLKSAIESVSGTGSVKITNNSGKEVTSGNLGTGFKVELSNGVDKETLSIVIKGDTSGDGVINALDLLQVQKNILGTYSLSGAYSLAGETSGDGVINALDLLQIQKNILGSFKIEQK